LVEEQALKNPILIKYIERGKKLIYGWENKKSRTKTTEVNQKLR
jgi:hypothetical protein